MTTNKQIKAAVQSGAATDRLSASKVTRQPRRRQADKRRLAAAAWESTAVSRLFEGQMSYMTLCMHCDHQAHSTQTFTVLSLPIPTDTIKCTIEVTL